MSPSWLDAPLGVVRVRLSRAAVRLDAAFTPVAPSEPDGGQPPWQASLQVLERMIQAESRKRKVRRVRVVLTNDFVRYLLIPWTAERLTVGEREQLARALFLERYGDGHWQLAVEPQAFERPSLAAAIDADLLSALKNLAARHNCQLISVIPALVDELNRNRRRCHTRDGGWLVDASDGRLAMLAFVRGIWRQVGNERYAGQAGTLKAALLPLLRRDALRIPELMRGTVFLAHAGAQELTGRLEQAWPVIQLDRR